jgi:uncharacterized protein
VKKTDAFCDTSALVPLFSDEPGSVYARSVLNRASVTVWWGTVVEMTSALARLARERTIEGPQKEKAGARLRALRDRWIEVLPSERVRELALVLVERHPLRAADALQLAAALVWANERPRSRLFVCLDGRLADAARKEGFEVAP